MRRLVLAFALTLSVAGPLLAPAAAFASEGCYICQRGSSCGEQCSYGAKDTSEARKACEKKGCKIGGTKSCSTAANVKTCTLPHADTAAQSAEAARASSASRG